MNETTSLSPQPSSLTLISQDPPADRKILLLDLVWTTAIRGQDAKQESNYYNVIYRHETYREELLSRVRSEGWFIVLFTARHTRYTKVTLANMEKRVGFVPDAHAFAVESGLPPVTKKHNLLEGILPKFGYDARRYLSLESNAKTRAMLSSQGLITMTREDYYAGAPLIRPNNSQPYLL